MTQARQSMFLPCNECYTFITHDLTEESYQDGMEFIPRQIFEGDSYIQFDFDMFGEAEWTCFPCLEKIWDENKNIPYSQKDEVSACDFINGQGKLDCRGCEKCNQWNWNHVYWDRIGA